MEKKRFFILCILIFISLFNFNLNEVKLNADGDINEEVTTTFVHSAGRTSSILLSNQGVVYGWGLWGEASNVSLSKKFVTPTNLSSNIDLDESDYFIDVVSGEQHSLMLTYKGRVFGFGSGEKRQLGYSDYLFKSTPVEITEIFSLNLNEKITVLACGDDFNIALTSNNRVLSFGLDEDGQLGINEKNNQLVNDITDNFVMQDGDYLVDVKCGADHSIALSKNGYAYVWGSNKYGQLGIKDVTNLSKPTRIESIQESVIAVASGRYTSYVLTNQAQLYGFGSDSYGQLATHDVILTSNKKMTPYLMNAGFDLENDEYIKEVHAGYYYAIVKTNKDNLFSFGQNSSGQLGNNSTLSTSVPQKLEYKAMLDSIDEIVDISCGQDHCLATTKYGHILSWGSNLQGQLSEDSSSIQAYYKMVDITYNFPPIVIISTNASSIAYQSYVLEVEAYYLDNEQIGDTYYCISDSLTIPIDNWKQFNRVIEVSEGEGNFYVHIKIDSKKDTYYHVSKAYFLDHIAPEIKGYDENNKEILSFYHNSTIFVKALDNNNSVEIICQYNDEIITTESNTLSCSKDGNYVIYAKDAANNTSATIEFQIDTILPTITKIESNLIQGTSFNTREKQITITGSEALSCYKLGYKGVDSPFYTALNDNESSFTINLKKGVNTLTICDLAGNESLTYEINYSPRFFQDTQLLLIVFSSIAALFVILIIVVYTIKNKRKLIK